LCVDAEWTADAESADAIHPIVFVVFVAFVAIVAFVVFVVVFFIIFVVFVLDPQRRESADRRDARRRSGYPRHTRQSQSDQ
jgi:cbb3-type cytochrome oxidase subunit 3